MNIEVKVDDVSLNTIVAEAVGYDENSGDLYEKGGVTVAHLVASMVVDRLVQDRDRWYEMSRTVTEIKRDVIREAVLPMVEKAIAEPIQKTSVYGDPIGDPVTLREVIVDEARKLVNKPAEQYSRSGQTILQKVVAEEVRAAFGEEIKDAVKQAREQVAGEIGQQVAAAVANAMKGR